MTIIFLSNTNNETGLRVSSFMWAITAGALDTIQYMDLDVSEDVLSVKINYIICGYKIILVN